MRSLRCLRQGKIYSPKLIASQPLGRRPCQCPTQTSILRRAQCAQRRTYGNTSVLPTYMDLMRDEMQHQDKRDIPRRESPTVTRLQIDEKSTASTILQSSHVATAQEFQELDSASDLLKGLPIQRDSPLLDLDYKKRLPLALHNRQSDLVVRCLLSAARAHDVDFIRHISNDDFSEILIQIGTDSGFHTLAELHRDISPSQQRTLRTAPATVLARDRHRILRVIFRLRRLSGCELTCHHYTILLRHARDLSRPGFAHTIFRHLRLAGHVINTSCWNLYMEAVLSLGDLRSYTRKVHGRSMRLRTRELAGQRFEELKSARTQLFEQMCEYGSTADQETYRILLAAATRDRDVPAVNTILKTAFGLDPVNYESGITDLGIFNHLKERPAIAIKDITQQTLLNITRAMMLTKSLADILRILNDMSSYAEISITTQVWEELFEHAFMLAKVSARSTKAAAITEKHSLAWYNIKKMWDMMTGPTCKVIPTMRLYKYCIKALYYARAPIEMLAIIEQSAISFAIQRRDILQAEGLLSLALDANSPESESLRHTWEAQQLERRLHASWIRRSVQLVLQSTLRNTDIHGDATLRALPRAMASLHRWMPYRVKYEVAGGMIEFDLKNEAAQPSLTQYKADRRALIERLKSQVPLLVGQHHHVQPDAEMPPRTVNGSRIDVVMAAPTTR